MSDLLAEMAAASRVRADLALGQRPALAKAAAEQPPPKPLPSQQEAPFLLFAEVKLVAPSQGVLAAPDDPIAFAAAQARRYDDAGADALSILTEPSRFAGAISHLQASTAVVRAPTMRKDFLVDPIQLLEARAAGASGALLVVRMLPDATLDALIAEAERLGMWLVLEAFDLDDLARIATRGLTDQRIGGVNVRDLRTLRIEASRLAALAPHLPPGRVLAESGMNGADDARDAAALGYGGALCGSALMRAEAPGPLVHAMRAAGTTAATRTPGHVR
jgi:indole-3-glycerol phosphate synthase